jgi:cytochrome P450
MYLAGANRDPREFDRPDEVDIDGNVNRPPVTFTYGK